MRAVFKAMFLLFMTIMVLPISSCEEERPDGGTVPMKLQLVSLIDSKETQVTVKDSSAYVVCGPAGGLIIVKCSSNKFEPIIRNTTSVDNENHESSDGKSYMNDWCNITSEYTENGTMLRIDLKEFKLGKEVYIHLHLSDQFSRSHGNLHIRRTL